MIVRYACLGGIGIIIAAVMIFSAANELSARSPGNGEIITPLSLATVPDDISLANGGGKFKYKSDDPYEAQQVWKVKGTCPTSYQSFDSANNFQIQFAESGQSPSLDHSFADPTGVTGRNGDRYKKKFFYYSSSTRSSGHHSFPSFGTFKAWIKDGQLKFMYIVKKANEGGMMMNMSDFNAIRDATQTNKIEKTVNLDGSLLIGSEGHGAAAQSSYTAKKKGLKIKMEK